MKSSKEIEKEIAELEIEVAPLNHELDLAIAEFASELPALTQSWIEGSVKRKIQEHSEQVMDKGAEYVKGVKADLAVLYSRLNDICSDAVGPTNQWPHNKQRESNNPSHGHKHSSESFFAASFRRAINHLGSILDKHGLLGSPAGYISDWQRTQGGFRYAINPGFSERDVSSVARYRQIRVRQEALVSRIEAMNSELTQARAKELWDDA